MTASCPAGHESAATDFCDHCGLRIPSAGMDEIEPAAETATPSGVATRTCASCGEADQSGRFCEGCGFDLEHGTLPAAEPTSGGSDCSQWEAVVEIGLDDRRQADAEIAAPAEVVQRRVLLSTARARVGRRRVKAEDGPEIDLAQDPADTGVSHEHAELVLVDGGWSVVDLGSTNGTYLNDGAEPIQPHQPAPLHDGDRIQIGAWTTITIDRVASDPTERPPEPET